MTFYTVAQRGSSTDDSQPPAAAADDGAPTRAPALGARGARHAGLVALATFLLANLSLQFLPDRLVCRLWLWCVVQAGAEASKITMVKLFEQERKGEKAKLRGRSRAPVSSPLVVRGTTGNKMKPSVHLSHCALVTVTSSS